MWKTFLGMIFFASFVLSSQAQIVNIDVDSAYNLIQANQQNPDFVILDVRTPFEYWQGHIQNGAELDFYRSDFFTILDSLNKSKVYMIHCASGGRSGVVRDSMAAKAYQHVFNMLGGFGAWSQKYPVTTQTAPVLMNAGDSVLSFPYTIVGDTGVISVRLTNYGNDTLRFGAASFSGSSHFFTDFDSAKTLLGYLDHTFNIYYTPAQTGQDSAIFTIASNGGTVAFSLKGTGSGVGFDKHRVKDDFFIFPNPAANFVNIRFATSRKHKILLFSIQGRLLKTFYISGNYAKLSFSSLEKGVYILKSGKQNKRLIIWR